MVEALLSSRSPVNQDSLRRHRSASNWSVARGGGCRRVDTGLTEQTRSRELHAPQTPTCLCMNAGYHPYLESIADRFPDQLPILDFHFPSPAESLFVAEIAYVFGPEYIQSHLRQLGGHISGNDAGTGKELTHERIPPQIRGCGTSHGYSTQHSFHSSLELQSLDILPSSIISMYYSSSARISGKRFCMPRLWRRKEDQIPSLTSIENSRGPGFIMCGARDSHRCKSVHVFEDRLFEFVPGHPPAQRLKS